MIKNEKEDVMNEKVECNASIYKQHLIPTNARIWNFGTLLVYAIFSITKKWILTFETQNEDSNAVVQLYFRRGGMYYPFWNKIIMNMKIFKLSITNYQV